jgi:hypothetical protein
VNSAAKGKKARMLSLKPGIGDPSSAGKAVTSGALALGA